MKRNTVLTLVLGAALVLIPIVELQAQNRRNRGNNNPNDPTQQGDNTQGQGQGGQGRGGRNSRFSGYSNNPAPPIYVDPAAATSASTLPGASTAAAYVEAPRPGKPLPGDFEILGRKSIFDKDRRVRAAGSDNEGPRQPTGPRPIYTKAPGVPILVGVLLGDDDYIAYVEDPDSSKLWPIAAGDSLPQDYGIVRQVNIDDIEVVKDGASPRHILIGQNLKGEIPVLPPTDSYSSSTSSLTSSSSSSSSGIAPATLPAGTADMTIEQRMKLRRQQQVGQ